MFSRYGIYTAVITPSGVICDQIRLWEIERDRFLFTEGVLYNQFLAQRDFELLRYFLPNSADGRTDGWGRIKSVFLQC